jgi:hypothetical protein
MATQERAGNGRQDARRRRGYTHAGLAGRAERARRGAWKPFVIAIWLDALVEQQQTNQFRNISDSYAR